MSTGACDSHDLGQPCPQLLQGVDASDNEGMRSETQEVVGQDLTYPCEELLCVASGGKTGYCSKKCRGDSGCPTGFECKAIHSTGEMAGQTFCVWKTCESAADCGSSKKFCCNQVSEVAPKLCEFSNGQCG
ncbi:MAG: hypothetical protein R3C68_14810 [Myxococcota bacterium]